jgi:hypothetical protein
MLGLGLWGIDIQTDWMEYVTYLAMPTRVFVYLLLLHVGVYSS